MNNKTLDCGHKPSKHDKYTTGTAHTKDNKEICWNCAYKQEIYEMCHSKKYTAYINNKVTEVTTWTGKFLGKIDYLKETKRFGNKMIYFRFDDLQGKRWWGLSLGGGMYAKLYKYI